VECPEHNNQGGEACQRAMESRAIPRTQLQIAFQMLPVPPHDSVEGSSTQVRVYEQLRSQKGPALARFSSSAEGLALSFALEETSVKSPMMAEARTSADHRLRVIFGLSESDIATVFWVLFLAQDRLPCSVDALHLRRIQSRFPPASGSSTRKVLPVWDRSVRPDPTANSSFQSFAP